MTPTAQTTPQAIEWPTITVAGDRYTLRYAYSANYQLSVWGKTLADANAIELAAAMAGHFDKQNRWHSAGFARALDLADLIEPADEPLIVEAVTAAIKKAYPEAEVSARPTPGETTTSEAPKIESSSSGLLPSQTSD